MIEFASSSEVGAGKEQAALDEARAGAEETERSGRLDEAARLWFLTSVWEGNTMLRCARAREATERTADLARRSARPGWRRSPR